MAGVEASARAELRGGDGEAFLGFQSVVEQAGAEGGAVVGGVDLLLHQEDR